MKNSTGKRGFFAAAAVLLILTAILVTTGCGNGLSAGGGSGGDAENFTPPPGKGAISLNFNREVARSILPEATDIDDFTTFDFVFTSVTGGTSKTESDIEPDDLENPITLDPGVYTLTVLAYIDSNLAAKNDPAVGVTIIAGKTARQTITLRPLNEESGEGYFKYTISSTGYSADDIISAVMAFTKITGTTTQGNEDLISVWNVVTPKIVTVAAGDWYVDITVKTKSGDTVTFRHVLHIYHYMTSIYDFTIEPDYFNAAFKLLSGDLTYEHVEDIKPVLSDGTNTLSEGETVTVTQGASVTITVTNSGEFTGVFQWSSSSGVLSGSSNSYVVETGIGKEFNAIKSYQLTVIGTANDDSKPYSSFINIEVVKP